MSMQGINSYYVPVTAGTQVMNRAGALHLVSITAAAATAVVTIYNNTSATGNPIAIVSAPANTTWYVDFDGLPFGALGLFVVVAGAGGQAILTAE